MKYRTLGKAIDKMKSFKNLYTKLLDKEFIAECIYKASRGKRKRRDVKRVLNNVPHYVEVIYEMLDTDRFEQKPHRVREITDSRISHVRLFLAEGLLMERDWF